MLEIILDHTLSLVSWLVIFSATAFLGATLISSGKKNKDKVKVEINDLSRELEEDQFEFLKTMGEISESANFKYKVKKEGGHLFLLDYMGSVDASEVDYFRNEVTAVLAVADKEKDEVLIKLNSGGGVVNGYGLVASQIERIKSAGVMVTCAVDEVAASGGYMAACVADRIIAAPFAYIGSIGVVSSFPNFKEALDKIGVTFKEYTAGESKRVISQYRDITPEQEKEYIEDLEDTHESFIKHVMKHRGFEKRPEKVFTGKHWIAQDAIEMNLVDEIMTSDEYVENFHNNEETGTVFGISTFIPKDASRYLDRFFKVAIDRFQSTVKRKVGF